MKNVIAIIKNAWGGDGPPPKGMKRLYYRDGNCGTSRPLKQPQQEIWTRSLKIVQGISRLKSG